MLLANLQTFEYLRVSSDCLQITGYNEEEVMKENQFLFEFPISEHTKLLIELMQQAWQHVLEGDRKEKLKTTVNLYYKAQKKDGTIVHIQHQNIVTKLDENDVPLLNLNVLTDVTHLSLCDEPKIVVINHLKNTCYTLKEGNQVVIDNDCVLTKREKEILNLVAKGVPSREIADKLSISYHTVRKHRGNMMEKVGAQNMVELINYASSKSLINIS